MLETTLPDAQAYHRDRATHRHREGGGVGEVFDVEGVGVRCVCVYVCVCVIVMFANQISPNYRYIPLSFSK